MSKKWLFLPVLLISLFIIRQTQKGTLERLPFWNADEFSAAQWRSGGVQLDLYGNRLPYDTAADTFYLPLSREAAFQCRDLGLANGPDLRYGLIQEADGTLFLCAEDSNGLRRSRLVFTSLPILSIHTADASQPSDEDTKGQLLMLTGIGGKLKLETSAVQIRLRGNTSRRYPKQSFRVQTVDEEGTKRNVSIGGLRSDDDWILNPMYSDTSKIREPLSYWIWEQMDSSAGQAVSTRVSYAELLLNGSYWGLYGVQERVDRKQLNADRHAGLIYKVYSNTQPSVQELMTCEDPELCGGFEISYAGSALPVQRWEPAASYMAFLNGEHHPSISGLSLSNLIDYGLWAMTVQAYDCHFKNQFLNCVSHGSGYTMYKIPWDLNHTLGDAWNGESPSTNYLDYVIDDQPVLDDAFARLLDQNDPAVRSRIQKRWSALRSTFITQEAIVQKANELFGHLHGALERDTARWPGCGMGDGNAAHIQDIEVYVQNVLPIIDAYIGNL